MAWVALIALVGLATCGVWALIDRRRARKAQKRAEV